MSKHFKPKTIALSTGNPWSDYADRYDRHFRYAEWHARQRAASRQADATIVYRPPPIRRPQTFAHRHVSPASGDDHDAR